MTKCKLLSAGLIAAAVLVPPAMARESHVRSRHAAESTYAAAPNAACVRAPRVGAFATQPWANPPCEPATAY
jgi:hypothetical protein